MAKNMDPVDLKFVKAMIVHHQNAISMANKYIKDSNPTTRQSRIVSWAQQIASGQTSEIEKVTKWLEESGASSVPSSEEGGEMKMSELSRGGIISHSIKTRGQMFVYGWL